MKLNVRISKETFLNSHAILTIGANDFIQEQKHSFIKYTLLPPNVSKPSAALSGRKGGKGGDGRSLLHPPTQTPPRRLGLALRSGRREGRRSPIYHSHGEITHPPETPKTPRPAAKTSIMKPEGSPLSRWSTRALLAELKRREEISKPRRCVALCEECQHFHGKDDADPEDYNPCSKGHHMLFRVPETYDDRNWGFYRPGCRDRKRRSEDGQ